MSLRQIFNSFMVALYFFILFAVHSGATLTQVCAEPQVFPVNVFNISARADDLTGAAIVLDQVEGAVIRNCQALPGTGTFLRLRGRQTRDICLIGNELSMAGRPVSFSEEVREKKIKKLD